MNTLEVPIEIEVYEGCASAAPVFPRRPRRSPRRTARRRLPSSTRPPGPGPAFVELDAPETLQLAGALPSGIYIE